MEDQTPTVRIKFRQPGTRPPVFVAGSFTSPPWAPKELQYTKKLPGSDVNAGEEAEDADLEFQQDFKVPEGRHQYKFRLGHGDWWVCDETVETVTDDAGNRNNLLTVQPSTLPQEPDPVQPDPPQVVEPSPSDEAPVHNVTSSLPNSPRLEHAPLFAHESNELAKGDSHSESPNRKSGSSTPLHSQLASRVAHPTVESFPDDSKKILEQIETTMLRVKEDETSVKGSPASPVVSSKHGLATPPSSSGASPALNSISEENLAEPPKGTSFGIGEPLDVPQEDPPESEQSAPTNPPLQTDGAQDGAQEEASVESMKSSESLTKVTPGPKNPSEDKEEGFLHSFWQVVFVDFFGGLFASLCGRRRHEQILMASTLILAPAVALYLYKH